MGPEVVAARGLYLAFVSSQLGLPPGVAGIACAVSAPSWFLGC